MQKADFMQCLQLLSTHNNTQITVNPIKNGTYAYNNIVIHSCTAACTNALIKAGYSLSMCNNVLSVDFY